MIKPSRWVPLKRRRQRTRRTRNIGAVEVKLRPTRRAGGQVRRIVIWVLIVQMIIGRILLIWCGFDSCFI